jgi:hypothetical protein
MPLDLKTSTLDQETRRLVVHLEAYDEDIWVEYVPGRYNAAVEEAMVERFTKTPAMSIREMILTFVVDWDLEYDGQKIPIDVDGLKMVPTMEVQIPIGEKIVEDMSEGKVWRSGSRSPSSLENRQQRRSKARVASQAKA